MLCEVILLMSLCQEYTPTILILINTHYLYIKEGIVLSPSIFILFVYIVLVMEVHRSGFRLSQKDLVLE